MEPEASVPAREVKGVAVGAGIECTTDVGDSHEFSMCKQPNTEKPVFARSGETILLCVTWWIYFSGIFNCS